MKINQITLKVANAICGGNKFDSDNIFWNDIERLDSKMFTHFDYYYQYPEFGKKYKDGINCQFHKIETYCFHCGNKPERNLAGVGHLHLYYLQTNGRMVLLCENCNMIDIRDEIKAKLESLRLQKKNRKKKPALKPAYYPGNKKINGVYHKIINQIPAHTFYFEPFAGSAAIASLLPVSAHKVINDYDIKVFQDLTVNYKGGGRITNMDAIQMLQVFDRSRTSNYFIFLDPPYLHSTRPNSTAIYNHEMTDDDHIKLLEAVLQLNCNIMIIHPVCGLYDSMLKNWRTIQIKIRYHNKTSIENLYMNYPEPDILQTYQYLGKDCWDRQRIKRKGDRLVNKLMALPVLEREYILNELKKI